ncbi:HmuY family protein [Flavobacterium adhaerens]|uniref:HmuY family protein n=1 Tax=Flavobacterium adhaerens TaxID=3149043 RepID=UPI0032B371BA
MKNKFILFLSFALLALTACNNDDDTVEQTTVALEAPSINLSTESATTPVVIKFDKPTSEAGLLTLTFTTTGVNYGIDFTTSPAATTSTTSKVVASTSNTLKIPFEKNAISVTFIFNKLIDAIEGEVKNVTFKITDASGNIQIAANNSIQVSFNETPSLGNALAPEVGGPNEPNQVFVDLSTGMMTNTLRTSWDLGFYTGTEFRVIINSTVRMAAKQLETTNIDEVQAADDTMLINQGQGIASQIDDVTGDITKTAIAEVSATDSENKVYLINMGSNPATTTPTVGKEGAGGGTSRGWMKIRILRSGAGYKIQYATIDATTHNEATISKDAAYNFTFFSLLDQKTVTVEPQKAKWDLSFTSFTNTTSMGGPLVPYFYPDFILNNLKGEAKTYQVLTSEFTYDNFTLANVDNAKFTNDQRNIGSNWRSTVGGTNANGEPISGFAIKLDRFFVVKDPAGNLYKVKFTSGLSDTGERGYPKFQYAILK